MSPGTKLFIGNETTAPSRRTVAFTSTEAGRKTVLEAKGTKEEVRGRVRSMRELFHETFVTNVPKRFERNWDAHVAAKALSKELGEAGGETYTEVMNLLAKAYESDQNYVDLLEMLSPYDNTAEGKVEQSAGKFLLKRERAGRVVTLKNLVHDAFVKSVPEGYKTRWDIFEGAKALIHEVGEEGGERFNNLVNDLKFVYRSQEDYEGCIKALGGSIEPPKPVKKADSAKAEAATASAAQ